MIMICLVHIVSIKIYALKKKKIVFYITIVPYIIDKVVHSLKTNMEL